MKLEVSLDNKTGISRSLLLIGGLLIPIIGILTRINEPDTYDPLALRFAIGILALPTFILSFFNEFVKRNLYKFLYVYYTLTAILFEFLLYENNMEARYVLAIFIVFIGMSVGFSRSKHLKIYILLFSVCTFITAFSIENPATPLYSFTAQFSVLIFINLAVSNTIISINEKLQLSNNNFSALLDSISESFYLVGTDYKIIELNKESIRSTAKVVGVTPRKGDSLLEICPPHEIENVKRNIKKAFNGTTVELERRIKFEGREQEFWFSIKYIPVKNKDNEIYAVLFTALNISDKKSSELELKTQNHFINKLLQTLPLGLRIHNISSDNSLWINNQLQQHLGYSDEEWQAYSSSRFEDLIYEKDRNKFIEAIASLHDKSDDQVLENDYRIRSADDTWVWVRSFMTGFKRNEVGKVTEVLEVTENITERKKTMLSLVASERRFRDLFELAPVGIFISSFSGAIKDVNKALCDTLGYSKDELLDKNLRQIIGDGGNFTDLKKLKHLFTGKAYKSRFEKEYIGKGGKIISTITDIIILEEEGHGMLLGQVVDISHRIEAEELVKHKNEELEKANTELDRFVYSAAHDLRAPLTSVMGLINLAKKEGSVENISSYLQMMEKSISKLENFISDVIDFSKNSRMGLNVEGINFKEQLENIFENHEYAKGATKIKKSIEIDCDRDFYTDRNRLDIVLNNLISNAIRYSDPSKESPFINVHVSSDEEGATIHIEDNGQGIDDEHIDKIFNIFYRGNTSSTGSGLGLYIVKETIDKLGGYISVDSKIQSGTTFRVQIPNMLEKVQ
ncbi:MAG: PAS domain S-box protein [Bacteroidota bacterium]